MSVTKVDSVKRIFIPSDKPFVNVVYWGLNVALGVALGAITPLGPLAGAGAVVVFDLFSRAVVWRMGEL